jgi:hypothetical protein
VTFANGKKGNLEVCCEAPRCKRRYQGRLPTEVKAFRAGVGGLDVDADPDFVMTEAKVRRQARRRGWSTVEDADGVHDLCPDHVRTVPQIGTSARAS